MFAPPWIPFFGFSLMSPGWEGGAKVLRRILSFGIIPWRRGFDLLRFGSADLPLRNVFQFCFVLIRFMNTPTDACSHIVIYMCYKSDETVKLKSANGKQGDRDLIRQLLSRVRAHLVRSFHGL